MLVLLPAGASADGASLAGSLWRCTRASDHSHFVSAFYPGGGVGGGELQDGKVSPYIFDASRVKEGRGPGLWQQKGRRFIWRFPDQHLRIDGRITVPGSSATTLTGNETASGTTSAISCAGMTKPPKIGEGLVIPRDSRFNDLDHGEGELKVPAGIPVRPQGW